MFAAPEEDGPFEQALRAEHARLIARAIAALSDRQKRVLVLIYVNDMSLSEAGTALDVSKVAVHKAHHRALNILARELAEMGLNRL